MFYCFSAPSNAFWMAYGLDNSISLRLVLEVNWSPGRDLAGKEDTRFISELLPGCWLFRLFRIWMVVGISYLVVSMTVDPNPMGLQMMMLPGNARKVGEWSLGPDVLLFRSCLNERAFWVDLLGRIAVESLTIYIWLVIDWLPKTFMSIKACSWIIKVLSIGKNTSKSIYNIRSHLLGTIAPQPPKICRRSDPLRGDQSGLFVLSNAPGPSMACS